MKVGVNYFVKIANLAVLSVVMSFAHFATASASEIRLGVNAPRGPLPVLKRWKGLADYLSAKVNQPVKIVPLAPSATKAALKANRVDFLLTNPVLTVVAEKNHGANVLLSLDKGNGSKFAGVIIARKDKGIKSAQDLKGKKVIGLGSGAAGGYMFQAYYLRSQGIDVPKDTKYTKAKSQKDIVMAVKKGLFDAGFVRTGMVERFVKKGAVTADEFVVIDQKKEFALPHSTPLYPEWYLSAVTKDSAMKDKISAAAKALKADEAASKQAKIKGFIDAQSRDQIAKMMTDMGVLK